MIKNPYRYTQTVVHGEQMLKDFGNEFLFVAQKSYKGNPEKGLAAGNTVTLQILTDNSAPVLDKETGLIKDDNTLETFECTVVGAPYPLDFPKGSRVALGGFLPEASYYINYSFILRFSEIKLVQKPQSQGGNNNAPARKE